MVILIVCIFSICRLDRKRQRKVKKWDVFHKKYVIDFETCVERAKESGWGRQRAHCPIAFNNYIRWFLASTRVELCPAAFEEEILEEPTVFDELAQREYNRMVRSGNQTPFSNVLNIVVSVSFPVFLLAQVPLFCLHNLFTLFQP